MRAHASFNTKYRSDLVIYTHTKCKLFLKYSICRNSKENTCSNFSDYLDSINIEEAK